MAATSQPINNRKEYEKFYSKELWEYIRKVEGDSKDFPVDEITPEFFVLHGLGNKNCLLYKTLNTFIESSTIKMIYDDVYKSITPSINTITNRNVPISASLIGYLKKSNNERKTLEHELITSDHVLLSILSMDNKITEIFNKYEMSYSLFMSLLLDMHSLTNEIIDIKTPPQKETPKIITIGMDDIENSIGGLPAELQKQLGLLTGINTNSKTEKKGEIEYCINLNKMAEKGVIGRITGRDDELSKIIEILNRRKSNNVVIVGDPGVGKTSLVDGLASKIVDEDVPVVMLDKKIWKLNISAMVAGTQFRGMFEERMTKLLSKLKETKNNILFIDDIHSAVHNNSKNSDYDIMGMLTEILTDGTVQVIVATNHKGYRNTFETHNSFTSKFQKIVLDKPQKEECFNILKYISPEYEKHHNVKYSDEVLRLCIDLSERYITERTIPTSAIDLMDEVGSHCFLKNSFSVDVSELKKIKTEINKEIKKALKNDDLERVSVLEKEIEDIDSKTSKIGTDSWAIIEKGIEITKDDVYELVSKKTGIPITKISSQEKKGLINLDKILKEKVIGQDDAIDTISRVIKRNKLGLSSPNKPIGSYLMIGKTGVGKTFLAKKIAAEVFGDEKYLIRFDMSEYSDKTSVNKLIGSSAGYIGYEEGGLLTEAIKKNKYAVLLVDEIEKANSEVFNLFLQILDEGFLTDNTGRKVDFKNTIIILTSNVGTKRASIDKGVGFNVNEDEKYKSVLEKELKDKFSPEFLNRLDEIVYFNSLTNENLREIIKIELKNTTNRFNNSGYTLSYDENTVEYILDIVSKEKEYGARPILRTIQKEIENKIVDKILECDNITSFNVKCIENTLVIC